MKGRGGIGEIEKYFLAREFPRYGVLESKTGQNVDKYAGHKGSCGRREEETPEGV